MHGSNERTKWKNAVALFRAAFHHRDFLFWQKSCRFVQVRMSQSFTSVLREGFTCIKHASRSQTSRYLGRCSNIQKQEPKTASAKVDSRRQSHKRTETQTTRIKDLFTAMHSRACGSDKLIQVGVYSQSKYVNGSYR